MQNTPPGGKICLFQVQLLRLPFCRVTPVYKVTPVYRVTSVNKVSHSRKARPASAPGTFAGAASLLLWFLCLAAIPLHARVEHKPGFNTFKPDQDIQLGKDAAAEMEKELALVSDSQLNDYINRLGQKLAGFAPGHRYPYRFSLVNAKEINAFALPGGPIYIHTGIILSAESEAQLAGVLAHEISHVALRHSTNQASKAMLAQAPLAILGGILSGGGIGGQLAQLGIGFGLNSVFLKFSRSAERQADQQGAQMLYDAGYDPRAMAQFFEIIEAESGNRGIEFLASHPNPGNRQTDVLDLIPSLGPRKSFSDRNSEFERMKRRTTELADAEPAQRPRSGSGGLEPSQPEEPSRRFQYFNADFFSIGYPDNWDVYGEGTSTLTMVPPQGIIRASENALPAIAYGAMMSVYEPAQRRGRRLTLSNATDQLIRELQRSNPNLRVIRRSQRSSGRQELLSVTALGQSPIVDETEVNWIVTTFRPEGLWYIVFIAPERNFAAWEPVFQQMLDSVRFPR